MNILFLLLFANFISTGATVYIPPKNIIKTFSSNQKQLWVVGYVNSSIEDSIKDLQVSFANGADAIVYEASDYNKLDSTLAEVRKRYPDKIMGVNFLGAGTNLYSYKETFALAKKHRLQIAWTDFSGVDLIKEAPEMSLHAIEAAKPENVFYVSGIHMKYSTLLDPNKTIEKSATQAMGWVDGIVITGPRTGVPTDPETARRARIVIADYPMGAASGVSAENVGSILKYVDYVLVNTSISDANHRIIGEKVAQLRRALNVHE